MIKFLPYVFIATLFVAVGCSVFQGYRDDNAVEEIAEEVEQIFPELVFYKDGQPESVKYHELPILLLNEIKKLNKRIEALEAS